MKPAATEITVQTASPRNWDPSVSLFKLQSDVGVLLIPAEGADHLYGFSVTEIPITRGLRRHPEPRPMYRVVFRPAHHTRYYSYKGLGAYISKNPPTSREVEVILRPVRLAGVPVGCQFLALVPNLQKGERDEREFIWSLCTALPQPSKVKAEKDRLKLAYKARRYMERATRFDRI